MITLAWYLLKVIICSGVLCGYYFLALRNKIFHRWNRFYLLASIVIALLVPLMKINIFQNSNADKGTVIKMLQTINSGDEAVIEFGKDRGFQFSSEMLAETGYLLISAVFLAIFFITLYKIRRLQKKYPETKIEGINFINTNAKGTPFSFFNSIFWNNAIDLHSKPGQRIFNHEIAHVKEKHSYDKIFMNVVLIFFWINPFFWLMRKELNMIHEFIADQKALEDNDLNAFAEMILQTVYPGQKFSITNNFFYSPLKRRLLMLTKNKNPKVNYLSRLLVLPLAVIVFFAFTLKVKNVKNYKMAYDGKTITVKNSQSTSPFSSVRNDTIPEMYYKHKKVINLNVVPATPNVKVTYSDGTKETITMAQAKKRGFIVPPPPPPPPPMSPQNPEAPVPPPPPTPTTSAIMESSSSKAEPLYIVDGKIFSKVDLKTLKATDIKSINILKGESAVAIYGDKGKNGIINIITKNGKNANTGDNQVLFNHSETSSNPLIFIDGKESSKDAIDKLNLSNIESVNVLKNESATKKYGDRGKNGVIEIFTKPNSEIDTIPDKVFTKVENEASFPGGQSAWIKYIISKLQVTMDSLTKKDYGTCVVKFIVNIDGTVSDVKATTMEGTKLAEISVNAIKNGPKWIPATQNGQTVAAYRLQPITVTLPIDNISTKTEPK